MKRSSIDPKVWQLINFSCIDIKREHEEEMFGISETINIT
jgi:hypothetical protein